jgi:hypothetical protein
VNSQSVYGFSVGRYDTRYPLVIDPLLASTFLGGGEYDYLSSLVIDGSGNVYVAGYTGSADFPTTDGAYDRSHNTGSHVFISKLDSSLSVLLASTFLGGGSFDYSEALALDDSGTVYVPGHTESPDFPTTDGAYDRSHNGGSDAFVTKLDPNLSTLVASTFLGGGSYEYLQSLAIDGSGNVYVAGNTSSNDFPTTDGAYDRSHNTGSHVFISKLDSSLSVLLASTFLGGGSFDYSEALALDDSGNVYVAGYTHSADFPTTEGAYDRILNGYFDVFVSKLDSSLSVLLSSTFLGGGSWDYGYALAVDRSGNVYVAGYTESADYPTTQTAHDRSYGGIYDAFVSKLDSDLSHSGPYTLTVVRGGSGTGTIVSTPQGIDCGSTCTGGFWQNDSVTLEATPEWDSAFAGWSGACSGTSPQCILEIPGDVEVRATFVQTIFPAADYFPLVPGTLWKYLVNDMVTTTRRVLNKKVTINGVETQVLRYPPGSSEDYYTSDGDGIRLHGSFIPNFLYSPSLGYFDALITYIPPLTMAQGMAEVGKIVYSSGTARVLVYGLGTLDFHYAASFTPAGFEALALPAWTFEALRLSFSLALTYGGQYESESGNIYLVKNIGEIKEDYTTSDGRTVIELAFTNAGVHDLAITRITPPPPVFLTTKNPRRTLPVRVEIQNRGPYTETILDETMLANLIPLTVDSLGSCPAPTPVLRADKTKPRHPFPLTLKSKHALTVYYYMTFDCANDPVRSTSTDPNHSDFRFSAAVHHAALDGTEDSHQADDACPRSVTPPYAIEPYPDGTIKDRGCGSLKPDGTSGSDVLADIIAR